MTGVMATAGVGAVVVGIVGISNISKVVQDSKIKPKGCCGCCRRTNPEVIGKQTFHRTHFIAHISSHFGGRGSGFCGLKKALGDYEVRSG